MKILQKVSILRLTQSTENAVHSRVAPKAVSLAQSETHPVVCIDRPHV